MIELTQQQRQAMRHSGMPIRVVDPDTQETFVLVRSDDYEQVKSLLQEEFHPSIAYPAMDRTFAEGWNDPRMDGYDRYEELGSGSGLC